VSRDIEETEDERRDFEARAHADQDERNYNDGFRDGKRSRAAEVAALSAELDAFEHVLCNTMHTIQFGWAGLRVGDCTQVKAAEFAHAMRQQARMLSAATNGLRPPSASEKGPDRG